MGFLLNAQSSVLINEVCSSNDVSILDEDGNSPDWIELYNNTSQSINLEGYFLSDDNDDLFKWEFPAIQIEPASWLLVFASGEDKFEEYAHTNFKVSKDGERLLLSNSLGELIDEILLPPLETDQSYGRQSDGEDFWYYFNDPSPELSNEFSTGILKAPKPIFPNLDHFSNERMVIPLENPIATGVIRYTLDATVPNENSILYTAPIVADTTVVIRAAVFADNYASGEVASQTYFYNTNHDLPIIALITDFDNLFDPIEGIFVDGPDADTIWPYLGANYWKDTEIPMHFEYYDYTHQLVYETDCGARTHGGRSARTQEQKPLRLLAKEKFGLESFDYPFFINKEVDSFKRLVLRNTSGDYGVGHIRDPFIARYLINEKLDLDVLDAQPCAYYINGQYWGIIYLREKSDEYFVQGNYGIEPTEIELLEEDSTVLIGTYDKFDSDRDFVVENDMNDPVNWERAERSFDTKHIADYFITQTAINNFDWPRNNLKLWRPMTEDGKWRYLLFDMDSSMGRYGWTTAEDNSWDNKLRIHGDNAHSEIMNNLLENQGYFEYFLNRYCDLLNTTFRSENFDAEITRSQDEVFTEMDEHFERWDGLFNRWKDKMIPKIRTFVEDRPMYARMYLQDFYQLDREVTLELNTYPQGAGKIKINTITIDEMPWDGIYFKGIPVELTIEPNPGFTFSHWQSINNIKSPISNSSILVDFEEDDKVFAVFESSDEVFETNVYPNPATDFLNLRINTPVFDQLNLELFDLSGRLVHHFPTQEIIPGSQEMTLTSPDFLRGFYILKISASSQTSYQKIFFRP